MMGEKPLTVKRLKEVMVKAAPKLRGSRCCG